MTGADVIISDGPADVKWLVALQYDTDDVLILFCNDDAPEDVTVDDGKHKASKNSKNNT